MEQIPIEFFGMASTLILEFALTLTDSLTGTNETAAVSLINNKMEGNARSIISNESWT